MLNNEIESKLRKIFIDSIDKEAMIENVNLDDSLNEIWVNSVNFVKICVLIEEAFGIELEDDALNVSYFKTLRNLIDYIEGKMEPDNGRENVKC